MDKDNSNNNNKNPFLGTLTSNPFTGSFSLPDIQQQDNPFGDAPDPAVDDLKGLSKDELLQYRYMTGEQLTEEELKICQKDLIPLTLGKTHKEETKEEDNLSHSVEQPDVQQDNPRPVSPSSKITAFLRIVKKFPEEHKTVEGCTLESQAHGISRYIQELHFTEENYKKWNPFFDEDFRKLIIDYFDLYSAEESNLYTDHKSYINELCKDKSSSDLARANFSIASILEQLGMKMPNSPLMKSFVALCHKIDHPTRILFDTHAEATVMISRYAETYDQRFLQCHMLSDENGKFLALKKVKGCTSYLQCVPHNARGNTELLSFVKSLLFEKDRKSFLNFGYILVFTGSKKCKRYNVQILLQLLDTVAGNQFEADYEYEQIELKFVETVQELSDLLQALDDKREKHTSQKKVK